MPTRKISSIFSGTTVVQLCCPAAPSWPTGQLGDPATKRQRRTSSHSFAELLRSASIRPTDPDPIRTEEKTRLPKIFSQKSGSVRSDPARRSPRSKYLTAHRQGQTQTAKKAIVIRMPDDDAIRRKHDLLAAEMHHYFWDICPELVARWKEAMLGLPPAVLRELAGRLQELEDFTDQTHVELRAAHDATAEDHGYTEGLLDRALASLEHLGEFAEAMTRRLDDLLKT